MFQIQRTIDEKNFDCYTKLKSNQFQTNKDLEKLI